MANHDGVEPTTAARAASGRAVLVAIAPQTIAELPDELRRKRPAADPRGVRLGDASERRTSPAATPLPAAAEPDTQFDDVT